MGNLFERVKNTVAERGLADERTPVLLMVSGGSDSTALAYLGAQLREQRVVGQIEALHVNHCIRGEEANADQDFVERLCALLDIPLYVARIDVPAIVEATGENLEAVARRERYQAARDVLESLCRHAGEPFAEGRIFTAHTADDRVENFYMRSIVGTGPGGFRAMRYRNGNVARPCLDVSRQDLRDCLMARQEAGLPVALARQPETVEGGTLWCEDATNAHTDRFRAFVRHEIVPKAKERNTALLSTLTRTMNLIADEDDLMDEMAQDLLDAQVEWQRRSDLSDAAVSKEGEGIDGGAEARGKESCVAGAACEESASGNSGGGPDAFLLLPGFAKAAVPLQRRGVLKVLQLMLGPDARVETASVDGVLTGFADGKPVSGYTGNIQGNLAVSANKKGVLIEPMERYRARRKRL